MSLEQKVSMETLNRQQAREVGLQGEIKAAANLVKRALHSESKRLQR